MKTLAVSAGLLLMALGWALALWARHQRTRQQPRAAQWPQEPGDWATSQDPATQPTGFKLTEFDELLDEPELVTAASGPDPDLSADLTATPNKTRRLRKILRNGHRKQAPERAPNGPRLRHRADDNHGMA